MKKQRILTSVLAVALLLALTVGLTQAQSPEPPEGEVSVEGGIGTTAAVGAIIPIQGRLTDASGSPINGTRTITFTLYDSGGTALCQDDDEVSVDNGLFSAHMNWCMSEDINGQSLYLGIQVESDPEMTDRQPIYPVPYAWSLRPGARIEGTSDGSILTVQNSGNGQGIHGYTQHGYAGVEGMSADWYGVWGQGLFGVFGLTFDSSNARGVYGRAGSDTGTTYGVYGKAQSPDGYGGYFVNEATFGGHGVYAQSMGPGGAGSALWAQANHENGIAMWGHNSSTDSTLVLSNSGTGDLIKAFISGGELRFRVDNAGNVYGDGNYSSPASDFAEMLPAVGGLEAGDVLAVDPDGKLIRSTAAYQPTVVGVYSTAPGFVGGSGDDVDLTDKIPLAVVGVVPVKASAENGPIQPGDLLVASATPGHAMKASPNPPIGTVIGKALEGLDKGTGVIRILVMLQ